MQHQSWQGQCRIDGSPILANCGDTLSYANLTIGARLTPAHAPAQCLPVPRQVRISYSGAPPSEQPDAEMVIGRRMAIPLQFSIQRALQVRVHSFDCWVCLRGMESR